MKVIAKYELKNKEHKQPEPMITHNNSGSEYWLLTVPEVPEAKYKISGTGHICCRSAFMSVWTVVHHEPLPNPGSYSIIGLAAQLSEEEWEQITPCVYDDTPISDDADRDEERGKIYECFDYSDFVCCTATASGLSLLSSHNLKPETTVIIKKM